MTIWIKNITRWRHQKIKKEKNTKTFETLCLFAQNLFRMKHGNQLIFGVSSKMFCYEFEDDFHPDCDQIESK